MLGIGTIYVSLMFFVNVQPDLPLEDNVSMSGATEYSFTIADFESEEDCTNGIPEYKDRFDEILSNFKNNGLKVVRFSVGCY